MKQNLKNSILIAVALAAAFGLGMWFMYFIMWADVFTKLIETLERISA